MLESWAKSDGYLFVEIDRELNLNIRYKSRENKERRVYFTNDSRIF